MYNTTDFFEKRSEINTALQAELNLYVFPPACSREKSDDCMMPVS